MTYVLSLLLVTVFVATWLTEIFVLDPIKILMVFNHPGQIIGIGAILIIAWCFGD
jgi:hypothetical protein